MKKFFIEQKGLILLWALCAIALLFFCGHYNSILFDIGREVYYPERIIEGKVLYKDLFNIYGPFSYLFNALLYKIFSPHLNTLYFSGIMCSFAIISGIYLISKKFLSEFLSVSLGIFTIATGVCATHLFNYTLPYSYGMLYGTVALLYSLWAVIKYNEENRTEFLYLAGLLGGICISCKYDFLIYGLILFILSLFSKNKKIILNFITCIIFVPVICGVILFFQGLGINDIINASAEIKHLMAAQSLKYFYTNQGIYFSIKVLPVWIINFIKTSLIFCLLAGGIKLTKNHKIIGYSLVTLGAFILFIIINPATFVFLAPLTVITAAVLFKKIKNQPALIWLLLGTLSVSIKCFWIMISLNYGNYVLPLLLCTFFAIMFLYVDKKYEKAIAIGILALSINYVLLSYTTKMFLNTEIKTDRGTIYTNSAEGDSINSLIAGLQQSNAKSAVIYPEGLVINFLTGIKSDDYYNSMLPLYIESMGEDKFINSAKSNKPEYIIFNNKSTAEYGANIIGEDFAQDFKIYVLENYELVEDMDNNFRNLVFHIKK